MGCVFLGGECPLLEWFEFELLVGSLLGGPVPEFVEFFKFEIAVKICSDFEGDEGVEFIES